jgi:hypothetical protein
MHAPHPAPPLVPADGPENPAFAHVSPSDAVHATALFARPLTPAELDVAEEAVLSWLGETAWDGDGDAFPQLVEQALSPACVHVAVTGITRAAEPLARFVEVLAASGVPVRRALFARLPAGSDREALVRQMDPGARPEVHYTDPGDWWRACFDEEAAPPLSEDRAELACDDNALVETPETTLAERRGMPLHVPGLRICYGLADWTFEDEPEERAPSLRDAMATRARDVSRVMTAALEARFRAGDPSQERPRSYNRLRHADGPLDRIRAADRVGYSCAFLAESLREKLHDPFFRYREHELMLALRDAARAVGLAPVVCWRRFTGRYVVQLWERGDARVHAAA